MSAVLGASLLAAGLVVLAWAYVAFRRPAPKPWTRPEFLAHAIALVVTTISAFGVAFLVDAFADADDAPPTRAAVAVLSAIGCATGLAVGLLCLRWSRLRAAARLGPGADVRNVRDSAAIPPAYGQRRRHPPGKRPRRAA